MKNTKYLMLQDALKKVLTIVLFIFLVRNFPEEEFGTYQQVLLVVSLASILFSAGVPVSLTYFYGQYAKYSQRQQIFKRFFIFQLLLLCLGAILLALFAKPLAELINNPLIEKFIVIILVLFVTTATFEYFKNLSVITGGLKGYLYLTTSIQLITVLINIFIVIFLENLAYVLFFSAFSNLLLFLFLLYVNKNSFLLRVNRGFVSSVEIKYIIAMGSVSLVAVLNGYIDQLMVSFLMDASSFATLKVGAFQIPFISIITGSLLTAMIPVISKLIRSNDTNGVIAVWKESIEKATVLLVPIVIFCLIYSNEIILTLFGEKYENSVIVFQVYMFQWLRAVVIFGGVMGAIGLEKALFKNTLVTTILNVVLNYFLISKYGVIGAAFATTFLNFFGAYLLIKPINKRFKVKFSSYFPTKIYITSTLLSVGLAFLLKSYNLLFEVNIFSLGIIAIVFYILMIIIQMKVFYKKVSLLQLKEMI
ncbi:oligosaccharide flippase family protein [Pseudoalteromonas sp. MER144-MNA-CIBAN-0113]|uniref:oligosaccharide flippase family protein n=1 Tax=Pseudoalteromonas sp. MER144-MNA-CIBAN-0113 TaxID=3140429 RepID=UPI00331ED2EB